MSLLTVVVPTFRRVGLLRHTLAAILEQDFTDFEVLVCDNDGSGECADLVASFDDHRLHYVGRSQNLGMMRNALSGLAAVRTPLLMQVNDDDVLEPWALRTLVALFEADPSLSIVFGQYRMIDSAGRLVPQVNERVRQRTRWADLSPGPVTALAASVVRGAAQFYAAVFRSDAVNWSAVDPAVGTAFDLDLLLRMAGAGRTAHYVPVPVVRMRWHRDAESSKSPARQLRGARAAVSGALAAAAPQDRKVLADALFDLGLVLVRQLERDGDREAARALLRQLRRPHDPRIIALRLWCRTPRAVPRTVRRVRRASRTYGATGAMD